MEQSDFLLCKFCFEVFKTPLILECGHSICKKCLTDSISYSKLKSPSKENPPKQSCPTCGSLFDIKDIQFYKENYSLKEIVEKAQLCKNCDNPAAVYCVICGSLCDSCFQLIHKEKIFSEHQKLNIGDVKSVNCSKHNKELEIYCRDCDDIICMFCFCFGPHKDKGHNGLPLSEYTVECKKDIKTDLEKVRDFKEKLIFFKKDVELMIDCVKDTHRILNEDIKLKFDEMMYALIKRKEELIKTSSDIEQSKLLNLQVQVDNLTKVLENTESLQNSSIQKLSIPYNLAIYKVKVNSNLKLYSELSLSVCCDEIMFTEIGNVKILKNISNFGYITPKKGKEKEKGEEKGKENGKEKGKGEDSEDSEEKGKGLGEYSEYSEEKGKGKGNMNGFLKNLLKSSDLEKDLSTNDMDIDHPITEIERPIDIGDFHQINKIEEIIKPLKIEVQRLQSLPGHLINDFIHNCSHIGCNCDKNCYGPKRRQTHCWSRPTCCKGKTKLYQCCNQVYGRSSTCLAKEKEISELLQKIQEYVSF